MIRQLITAALTVALAATAVAQQAPAADAAKGLVATVNGQKITRERLDLLWNSIPEEMRAQYTTSAGGKRGFLNNYIRKRLIIQEAIQLGLAKGNVPEEIEPAKESALFELYVREVIAPQVVTEAAVRKFYDDNPSEFAHPDRARVRMIMVSTEERSQEEARTMIQDVMKDLFTVKVRGGAEAQEMLAAAFDAAARKHSDHPSAESGGDLGWVTRDKLNPRLGEAVFTIQPPQMSGIIATNEGLHLLLVEERQAASNETFESARPAIREYLLAVNAKKVMDAVNEETAKLLSTGRVEVYADNVE